MDLESLLLEINPINTLNTNLTSIKAEVWSQDQLVSEFDPVKDLPLIKINLNQFLQNRCGHRKLKWKKNSNKRMQLTLSMTGNRLSWRRRTPNGMIPTHFSKEWRRPHQLPKMLKKELKNDCLYYSMRYSSIFNWSVRKYRTLVNQRA